MPRRGSTFALIGDEELSRKAFANLDKNGDGFLSDSEIDDFIANVGIQIKQEDLEEFKSSLYDSNRGALAGKCLYQVKLKT